MSLVGSLQDLHLEDILQIVGLSKKTGVLSIKWNGNWGRVVFKNGNIVGAFCSTQEYNLPVRLVEEDIVSTEESREVHNLLQDKEGYDALTLICERFGVDRPAIADVIKSQIERCMAEFFSLGNGTFNFELISLDEAIEELHPSSRPFLHPEGLSPQSIALSGLSNVSYEEQNHEEVVKKPPPTESTELPPEKSLYEQVEMIDLREELRLELGDSDFTDKVDIDMSVSPTPGLQILKGMIKELMDPQSSRQFLLLILRFASELMSRGIIFKVVDGELRGYGSFGVSIDRQEAEQRVRRIQVPLQELETFSEVIEKKESHKGPLSETDWQECFAAILGPVKPHEVFIAPVVVKNRAVFVFYGDDQMQEDRIGDTDSFEIFISQSGLAMEKVSLEDEVHRHTTY